MRLVLGEDLFVELTPEDYESVLEARRKSHIVLAVEEKLTLVLENYVEFESELLAATQKQLVFANYDWSAFMSQLYTFNRRLMNLLTVSRAYLDHIQHDLNTLYGRGSPQADSIIKQKSAQYDSLLGYRVMEALRNYVQHRGLPIFDVEYWGSWEVDPSEQTAVNIITPSLSVEKLREDGGFKGSVLSELEKHGPITDLKPLVREYMEGIGRVHQHFRDTVTADVDRWDALIMHTIERFQEVGGENVIGLALVHRELGKVVHSQSLSDNGIKRRTWLRSRTRTLFFRKRVVSSAAKKNLETVRQLLSDD